jgi:hypothetical protein
VSKGRVEYPQRALETCANITNPAAHA